MAVRPKTSWLIATALIAWASPAFARATADAAGATPAPAPAAQQSDQIDTSQDIVVTAQKRDQTLIQVPQAMSVVSGATLESHQATSLVDYAALVPGLTLQQESPGESRVILRGINTGGSSPTVAIYVDDVPFGSSTGQTNAAHLAGDIDPFDMQQIEVLKGPQGTLYGANSLGGLLKYVTNPPRFDKVELRGQAGVETIDGGGTGWSGNGVVNVPLGSTLAVRASGFYRKTPGYIDAIGRPARNVNDAESYGGRAALLFKPSDNFSIKLSALVQNVRGNARNSYDADPQTLKPISADPITGDPVSGFNRYQLFPDQNNADYRLFAGTLNWDLGFATLTSVTSYGKLTQHEYIDSTFVDAGGISIGDLVTAYVYGSPNPLGVTESSHITQKKFTQEVRLASPSSDTIEWLIGGYYTREPGQIYQTYVPFDRATAVPQSPANDFGGTHYDQLVVAELDSVYKEYAGFGSVTWHVGPRLDLTGGVRYSHNNQTATQILAGALAGGSSTQDGKSSEGVFTWSIAPRFQINDRVAVYARVAKGYRPGGPNVAPPGAGPDYPYTYKADTLVSYEAGVRGETRDHSFALDASVYYLDWSKIQVLATFQTALGPITADGNGKGASAYGTEITATVRPIHGLSIVSSLAYNDARLRGDTGSGGYDGDQLPYAPKWTVNTSADYEWALSGDTKAFVGATLRMVSDQPADFDLGYQTTYGHRLILDGYDTVDLRAGVDFKPFTLTVFAKNVANSRGLIYAGTYGLRAPGNIAVAPVQPRTIGATIGFAF
ncbi:TonB-dependent receptor [Hephaestia mangrovi]|uniref:TonB-dependent receptor n=1 Tax=Hephaestia mangrovi TaxID=2873268 RepID=UPI001CA7787B|nr:TonB-dependent receptor [Hephaestia mangrovi]MBY8829448.1 TonB-dependent receptor [Hephaestia mangrovi]